MTHYISGYIAKRDVLHKAFPGKGKRMRRLKQGYAFLPRERSLSKIGFLKGSQHGPVAYVETDYFGGVGEQSAILCEARQRLVTSRDGDAINQVLARMGVLCVGDDDEFDSLGLGLFRRNQEA